MEQQLFSLAHAALKHCYIYPFNEAYEDYRQIALLAAYQLQLEAEVSTDQLFWQMCWRIQDEKRRQKRLWTTEWPIFWPEASFEPVAYPSFFSWQGSLQQSLCLLNEEEKDFFYGSCLCELPLLYFQKKYHYSQATAYRRRKEVQNKLARLCGRQ